MQIKITKKQKLNEVCNDKCHNYYYLVHGRIINDDNTKYKKFRFVVWLDAFDICDLLEKDEYTKKDVLECVDAMTEVMVANIKSFDDCSYFYEQCNETINRYNNLNR